MNYLRAWNVHAPWNDLRHVEQDLIISRALCDLFNDSWLPSAVAFRGGTALHKLIFPSPLRYSEDIDLVQVKRGGIGKIIDAIRDALTWLGRCSRSHAEHSTQLVFTFHPEADPERRMRLKIDINTREHDSHTPHRWYAFQVSNPWYSAATSIRSFSSEELLATKFRALLQRRKHRDLFDLGHALEVLPLSASAIVEGLVHYAELDGKPITRAIAEQRMLEKLGGNLHEDVAPLVPTGIRYTEIEALAAFERVWNELVIRLPGQSWKSTDTVLDEIRATKYPRLLQGASRAN